MELIPAFRCERCGYDLVGIPADGACPECGTATADSRPERRPGLPWQLRPGVASWIETFVKYLVHPLRAFKAARVESRSMRRLALINLALCPLLAVIPLILSLKFGMRPLTLEWNRGPGSSTMHIVFDGYPGLVIVLGVLIAPLALGVLFWAAKSQAARRTPPQAPATVWISAGLTSYAALFAMLAAHGAWIARWLVTPDRITNASDAAVRLWSTAFAAPSVLFLAILAGYAVVDNLGNRANRLANSLDPRD